MILYISISLKHEFIYSFYFTMYFDCFIPHTNKKNNRDHVFEISKRQHLWACQRKSQSLCEQIRRRKRISHFNACLSIAFALTCP